MNTIAPPGDIARLPGTSDLPVTFMPVRNRHPTTVPGGTFASLNLGGPGKSGCGPLPPQAIQDGPTLAWPARAWCSTGNETEQEVILLSATGAQLPKYAAFTWGWSRS